MGTTFSEPLQTNPLNGVAVEIPATRSYVVELTADQVNASETGVDLISAPESGYAYIVDHVDLYKEAGTAYTGSSNFEIRYSDDAGTFIAGVAMAGFSNQTTAEFRTLYPVSAVGTAQASLEPVSAKIVFHSSGAISGGTGSIFVRLFYRLVSLTITKGDLS